MPSVQQIRWKIGQTHAPNNRVLWEPVKADLEYLTSQIQRYRELRSLAMKAAHRLSSPEWASEHDKVLADELYDVIHDLDTGGDR